MHVQICFVIYVICREIELVNSADELDFWGRHPKNHARRALGDLKHKTHPNHGSKSQLILSKGKKDKTKKIDRLTKKTTIKNVINATEKLNSMHTSQMRAIDDTEEPTKWLQIQQHRSTASKGTNKTEKLKPVLRSRTQGLDDTDIATKSTKKWPKIHQNRYTSKNKKDTIRSTRSKITPLPLVQREGPSSTKAKVQLLFTEVPKEDDGLSPYSIKQKMIELSEQFFDANITVEVIGRTVEYNDIVLLKVTERNHDSSKYFRAHDSRYVDDVPEKKIIFIVHGLSVMGIYSLPCLVKIADFKLLLSYYFEFLDRFDIFLIPMANPDGFAMQVCEFGICNSLWNKNMSPQGACPGVALDRNFDVAWNVSASINSCNQHFPGKAPFSEPETKAIRDVLHHYGQKIVGFFHVHAGSYSFESFKGDAVLYPKGYTDLASSDDDKYIDLRGEIDEAMRNASFKVLTVSVEPIHDWYGKVFGSSVDYASTVYGIPYTMELVMQPYADTLTDKPSEKNTLYALKEVWRRVIDVVFNDIWRNTKNDK